MHPSVSMVMDVSCLWRRAVSAAHGLQLLMYILPLNRERPPQPGVWFCVVVTISSEVLVGLESGERTSVAPCLSSTGLFPLSWLWYSVHQTQIYKKNILHKHAYTRHAHLDRDLQCFTGLMSRSGFHRATLSGKSWLNLSKAFSLATSISLFVSLRRLLHTMAAHTIPVDLLMDLIALQLIAPHANTKLNQT